MAIDVTVVSPSMEPTIQTGETVRVRTDLPFRVGDVAAFEHEGRMFIHRLVARIEVGGRVWFVHRGDASPRCGIAAHHEIVGVIPGLHRRTRPPQMLLFFKLGAVMSHLGFAGELSRSLIRFASPFSPLKPT